MQEAQLGVAVSGGAGRGVSDKGMLKWNDRVIGDSLGTQ